MVPMRPAGSTPMRAPAPSARARPRTAGGSVEDRPATAGQGRQHAIPRPLREHEREVDEQRRQQKRGHLVGPVENPVDAIEPAGEGEGEDAVEGHREPEEVQGGLIGGTAGSHRGADQQREDADRRQHVVERADAARDGRQGHLDDAPVAQREHRVGMPGAACRRLLDGVDVVANLDRPPVDGEQDVTGTDAGLPGRGARIDLGGDHAGRALYPQDAVLHVVLRGPLHDVHEPGQQQHRRHADREDGPDAIPPLGGRRRWGGGRYGHWSANARGRCKAHTTIRNSEAPVSLC